MIETVVKNMYTKSYNFETYTLISASFRISVFVINAIVLIYYYQMARFFIEVIQTDQKKARKFKLGMRFVISIIIITICQENLYVPILTLDIELNDKVTL